MIATTAPAEPLRLGFIGGSVHSAVGYTHYVASRMDGRFELKAGCFSTDADKNVQSAERYGVAPTRVYHDWQDMLEAESGALDAVALLTPTPMHAPMTLALLAAGFPVICEKALARNATEAKTLLDAVRMSQGFLAVTYNYSGYPMVRELRALIAEGALGEIVQIQVEMPQEGFIRTNDAGAPMTPQSWRLNDASTPTLHLDLAVHLHQLVYYLTGLKPVEATAMQDSFGWFPDVVDAVSALCRYSNGAAASFWFTKSALGNRNGLKLRLFGTKASAEWVQSEPEQVSLAHADGRRELLDRAGAARIANAPRYTRFKAGHPAGFVEAFANLYVDISACVREHRATGAWSSPEVFGPELALEGLHFVETLAEAAEKKAWLVPPGQDHQKTAARRAA